MQINIQARFGKDLIQTIKVSKKNLTWVKKEKEIIVWGKYFDVMSYKTAGDEVLLTGFYDHKEDELVKEIKNLIRQKKAASNTAGQIASNFLFAMMFFGEAEIISNTPWHYISGQYYTFDEMLPSAPKMLIAQPPQL